MSPPQADKPLPIALPMEQIKAFCARWKVREFSLFGSILRDDFGPDSDIDVLVSFEPDAPWSLWDLVDMRDQLATILGRDVDLIEKEALRNPFRRHEILSNYRVIHYDGWRVHRRLPAQIHQTR